MASNYSMQTDLKEAQAMVEGLSDYVRGDQLYGSTGGGFFSKMPSLTIGALLMRLQRLQALQSTMSDKQQTQFNAIYQQWQTTRNEWRSHYEQKVEQEIESRIDSMQGFFRECADSLQNCANNYRPEIQKRTIIHELVKEMNALNLTNEDLDTLMDGMDGKLRTYLRADEFQWSKDLQAAYPKSDYWWLYQRPPQAQEV
ncbi:MAG: hypothetical protein AAF846_28200 [Chloroflexota bacterium]